MTEKWRPSPSVLNSRKVRMRGFLTRKTRPFRILDVPVELDSKEPVADPTSIRVQKSVAREQ